VAAAAVERPVSLSPANIVPFAWMHRRWFVKGILLAFMRVIVLAPIPYIFKVMVDDMVKRGDTRGILLLSAVCVLLLVVHYFVAVAGARAQAAGISALMMELRGLIFDKLQLLSFGYIDRHKTGQLLAKYAFDTQKIEGAIWPMMNQFLPNILYSGSVLAILVTLNWRLGFVLALIVPIYLVARFLFFRKIKKSQRASRVAQEKLAGAATEFITALRMVRSLGEERQVELVLDETSRLYARARVESAGANMSLGAFTYGGGQILALLVVAGGALLSLSGGMSTGTLMAFMAAIPIIMMPVREFTNVSEQYFLGQESYNSVREVLEVSEVEDWKGTDRPADFSGEIEFTGVSFSYRGAGRPAVRDFDLKIIPGEHVAFVGPSGAGKSTLVSLLLGLYRPDHGTIRIGGRAHDQLDMRWFRRRQTAVVMQESFLLSGTVHDNIRFARSEATDGEVREAARQANAEEFIDALPDGYQTAVGERGVTLSGGQRQRIAIARAILRNPRILILDEPTSALDYENERLIQQAVERLTEKRTVITIAHRLSTIKNADRIVVMKDGMKVEEGNFRELSGRAGYFRDLLQAQAWIDTGVISNEA
jgi:ABC-type multidrug transport system fused ATPase/permease subunit